MLPYADIQDGPDSDADAAIGIRLNLLEDPRLEGFVEPAIIGNP